MALRTVASLHTGEVVLPFFHVCLDQALGCFAVVFLTTELACLLLTYLTDEFTSQSFPNVDYVLTVCLDTEHEILTVFCNKPITLKVVVFFDEMMIAAS